MATYDPDLWSMSTARSGDLGADHDARQALRVAAFEPIKPAGNWKGAISAQIHPDDFESCAQACIWFTGGMLEIQGTMADGRYWVTSGGYYENIGA